jgi:hypothetical protein
MIKIILYFNSKMLYNCFMMIEKETKMLSWNEMSPLEQAQCQYWDMYKDAYGCRPRGIDTTGWTLAEFDREFEFLANLIQQNFEQEQADQKVAVAEFEAKVETLVNGTTSREKAIAWLMDSVEAQGDPEYACYLFGLPYGYLKEQPYHQ